MIASNDGGRTPTYALSNPFPTGIQHADRQLARPADLPRRGVRTSRTRTSSCRTCTSSRSASSASCRGTSSLEASYAGSRSHNVAGELGRLQRAVGRLPGAVRRHAGRQPHALRRAAAESVLQRARLRRARRASPTRRSSRFELSRPFPAFSSIQMTERNDGKMTYDSLQFVANKRWAKGVTMNANYTWVPRWTEDGANTDDRHRQRVRRRRQPAEERRPLLLAAQASRHGVGRVGAAVVAQPEERARLPARRLVDRADVRLPVRPAVGHAGQRRHRARRRPQGHRARRQEGRAVHLRRQAVRRATTTPRPATTTCSRTRSPTAAPSRTS